MRMKHLTSCSMDCIQLKPFVNSLSADSMAYSPKLIYVYVRLFRGWCVLLDTSKRANRAYDVWMEFIVFSSNRILSLSHSLSLSMCRRRVRSQLLNWPLCERALHCAMHLIYLRGVWFSHLLLSPQTFTKSLHSIISNRLVRIIILMRE